MKKKIKIFLKELETELHGNILPYWSGQMVDNENKGFYGRIDGNNTVHASAAKGSVLNARILWTFSAAFNATHEEDYLNMANKAYDYCTKYFINREKGGVYWLIDYKGNPIEKKNQIYALAFMIYGLSEYYRATGISQAAEESVDLFHFIEQYSFDQSNNGYFEAFDENWVLLEDLRLSDKDANEKKTMNTHLHILEAYTNLYKTWDDPQLLKQLKNLIQVFFDRIIDPETYHFKLFFDENWNCMNTTISFGHEIEGSWLIQEASIASGDQNLIGKSKDIAVKMVDRVMAKGFDEDGGMFYGADENGVYDTDKHWWPQAEALVGLVNVWEITNDKKYLEHSLLLWEFIKRKIIDKKKGEWYFRISKDGKSYDEEDKAGFWKCPYHNSRACLEIIKRLSAYK